MNAYRYSIKNMILYLQVEVLSAVVNSIASSVRANAIIDVGSGQVVLQSSVCIHWSAVSAPLSIVLFDSHSLSFTYNQIAKCISFCLD